MVVEDAYVILALIRRYMYLSIPLERPLKKKPVPARKTLTLRVFYFCALVLGLLFLCSSHDS